MHFERLNISSSGEIYITIRKAGVKFIENKREEERE